MYEVGEMKFERQWRGTHESDSAFMVDEYAMERWTDWLAKHS